MKTRILIAAFATVLASIFTIAITPGEALAVSCTGSDHCYAVGYVDTAISAVGADLSVSCLSVANRATQFATHELWLGTNAGANTWVEVGMIAGHLPDGEQGFMWFWGDEGAAGIFGGHSIAGASTGTATNASIYWQGNQWQVFKGGHLAASLVGNGNAGTDTETGAETTTTQMTVDGNSVNYQYRNSSGWHWVPVSPYISPNASGFFSYWYSTATFGESTTCGSARTTVHRTAAAPIPSNQAQAARVLSMIAGRAAAANGGHAPGRISFVKTTRQRAEFLLTQAKVTTNQPVYVVEFAGHFALPRSPRAAAPQPAPGRTMTLTVDATTGHVTDWSISPYPSSPLRRLGTVISAP